MKKHSLYLTAFMLATALAGSAQTTREYLDYYFFKCPKDSAVFYRDATYDQDTVYHGTIKTYYLSGKQYSDIYYYHGIGEGLWTWWFENGQKTAEDIYDYGSSYRKNSWTREGRPLVVNGSGIDSNYYRMTTQLNSVGTYQNGNQEGQWTWWHKNGQLDETAQMLNDKELYTKEKYGQDGVLMIKEGNGTFVNYYKKGKVKSTGTVTNGKREGEWIWYHNNGRVSTKCHYLNGKLHGAYNDWFYNGRKKFEGNYINDKRDGAFSWWWWNGNLKESGVYTKGDYAMKTFQLEDGREMVKEGKGYYETYFYTGIRKSCGYYDSGDQTGLWKWYYKNGKLQEEGEFLNGKYNIISFYDTSGVKVVSRGTGEMTKYMICGGKDVKASYKDGKRHGPWTWYYGNGNINETAMYEKDSIGDRLQYYENTNKKFESIAKKDTTYKTWWYENGQKEQESYTLKEDMYIINRWNEKGVQMITNGKGLFEDFNEEHTLTAKGNYLNYVKDGKWEWFYRNGVTEKIIFFKEGALNGKYIKYNEAGGKTFEGTFKNNVRHGTCTWYNENGTLNYVGTYVDGNEHGTHFQYDEQGGLMKKTKFVYGLKKN